VKKLINDPADVVAEALLGVAAAHPELRVDHEHKIVYRGDAPVPGKVGLISGGGSGHEPLHGGFVGLGMLDAACAGEVFTSPVPDQMLEATRSVDGGAGVLHIVKNYTGDVMNFEMAAEMAAADTASRCVSVVTDDDVAVQDSLYTAGRRGVASPCWWRTGGAGGGGRPHLADVAEVAKRVNGNGRSMGMALTSCVVPAAGRPRSTCPTTRSRSVSGSTANQGRRRVPLVPAAQVAELLVEPILSDLDFKGGDGVLAFVNGMGATRCSSCT
jgi:dihydroxyacetone kinase-like protein